MGRTLHYELTPKNGEFTNGELEKVFEVSEKVRKSTKWTCEEFYINPYDIYPNWENKSTWNKLRGRQKCLLKEGVKYLKSCKILVEEKIASFFADEKRPKNLISSFTKVGGNEKNAMEVIAGLTAISIAVKNAEIKVSDEGKYLKCPIIIYQGKAMPDDDRIFYDIGYYMSNQSDPAYKKCGYNWKKMSKELYDIAKKYERGWFEVQTFCRYVCKKDFEKYPEYNAGQIMAGFDGEHYGLTDKDPEIESYKMSAMIKKMLPPGLKLEVAPKI